MKKRIITNQVLCSFEKYLIENEKAQATREKYMRDLRCFAAYVAGKDLDKPLVLDYKAFLAQTYAIRSANSMLAALNAFLRFQPYGRGSEENGNGGRGLPSSRCDGRYVRSQYQLWYSRDCRIAAHNRSSF